ncbi:telomerase Cajal body protein 1-like [Sycon ciliatum]|uniref:telomerase Cajal body protein 1-like n=1 Tax=Sycon ciliatum TaxID=27933 RepID=UPI0031F70B35|eukprot:scpid41046/ scgid25111/ Telomerase Cajal body protein 1; Guanine nucleotide-binding protein beta 5; WD repeat-containing protein 79; WD40 repeat-containing protein encoded by RNA antisense to p53
METDHEEEAAAESVADVDSDPGDARPAIQYDVKSSPRLLGQAKAEFACTADNFLRGCEWAPDGSCVLTCSNDNSLRVFNLPPSVYQSGPAETAGEVTEMESVLSAREGELIYDYCWYPKMNSSDPVSCFFLSSCRDHPVHLWDAYTGQLRCSYRPYNHLDEISAAHSLQFSADGSKLYCGFDGIVRIFDTGRPGRDCIQRSVTSKKQASLSGIVSCIAVSEAQPGIYALGSYSRRIGLYSEPGGSALFLLEGQRGGVTHLQFTNDGTQLISGGRKDNEMLCWDLRQPGKVLWRAVRNVITNQRILFDIDQSSRFMVSGNQDGSIVFYDMAAGDAQTVSSADGEQHVAAESSSEIQLSELSRFAVHTDAVNGCRLHPSLPLVATTSGQRKFASPGAEYSSSDSDSDCDGHSAAKSRSPQPQPPPPQRDNSLRIWSLAATTGSSAESELT